MNAPFVLEKNSRDLVKIEILDQNVVFNPSPHYWQRGQISRASMDRNVILNFLRESCIDTKMSLCRR